MIIEELVRSNKTYKGMELVDFAEVAMPIYRVTSAALIQERQYLPTIDEFVLRAAHLGFDNLSDIHSLLGISENVAKASLSSLIQSDLIHEISNGHFQLSKQGSYSAEEYSKVRPIEKQIVFDYDGIVRKVKLSIGDVYLTPKEIKEYGLLEIRAIPARKPEENEINVYEVGQSLSRYSSVEDSDKTVLRIKEITRAVRLFYKAAMLVYKENGGDRYEAIFFIDDILSESHSLAFIETDGLNRLGLIERIESNAAEGFEKEFPKFVFTNSSGKGLKNSSSSDRKVLSLKRSENNDQETEERKEAEAKQVRVLSVYEHPQILNDAIENASEKLIIISPWITKAVVNKNFSLRLEALIKKGVDVKIGYGIADDDKEDMLSQQLLRDLDRKYPNFTFKRLGDTHAKILIKDDEFYVITSFNWLSFKGDPKKKFREEWGNYVGGDNIVESFYHKISSRF